jgi:hypothetical protein
VSDADATASAALTALLHSVTGCAIPPTATIPESEVEELVPLCLSILRRHWTTPLTALGDGTTPMSLADLMRRLIGDRVQGNEALGIPPANANIPTAIAAMRDRKMSDGIGCADGLSLANLLCSSKINNVTEITDSNNGWTLNKVGYKVFPNVDTIILGCKVIDIPDNGSDNIVGGTNIMRMEFPNLEEILGYFIFKCSADSTYYAKFPKLKKIQTTVRGSYADLTFSIPYFEMPLLEEIDMEGSNKGQSAQNVFGACKMQILNFPSLKTIRPHTNGTECNLIKANNYIEEILLDNVTNFYTFRVGYGIGNCTKLKTLSMSSLKKFITNYSTTDNSQFLTGCTCLEKIVIGEGFESNLRLPAWNPTESLDNNLEQFLSNFKTYIAQRLTDKGSGLTLTLSQAVRDAIQQDPEIVSIITSKGWTISPAPSV